MRALGNAIERLGKRRDAASRIAARACERFLRGHYNADTNIATNGEAWLVRSLASPEPCLAIDAGANVGDWSAVYLAANPRAIVHAFEPVPAVCRRLVAGIADPRLVAVKAGLSDRSGTATIRFDAAEPHFSSLIAEPRFNPHLASEPIEVPLVRGDAYCAERGIEGVDFLKIDVEGHDFDALCGFGAMLDEGRVRVIQFERNYATLFARRTLADFFERLEPVYSLFRLLPRGLEPLSYHPVHEDFRQANFVALRTADLDAGRHRGLILGRGRAVNGRGPR